MKELEKALSKLTKYEGHPKRKLSKLYLKALKEGKIKHDPGK